MKQFTFKELEIAARYLKEGKVVAFPTETVFGLGVIYDDYDAYKRLIKIKRRNPEKPFTLMLSSIDEIHHYAHLIEKEIRIIEKLMPGEITLLVRAKENLPIWTHFGTNVIGVRVPNDEQILSLIKLVGKPLLVPSANREGEKPLVTDQEVIKEFANEIDGIILGKAKSLLPSTIVKVYDKIEILREGRISLEEILDSIGEN